MCFVCAIDLNLFSLRGSTNVCSLYLLPSPLLLWGRRVGDEGVSGMPRCFLYITYPQLPSPPNPAGLHTGGVFASGTSFTNDH